MISADGVRLTLTIDTYTRTDSASRLEAVTTLEIALRNGEGLGGAVAATSASK
jgi:hypothetical protein